ncbi:hypothetical protein Taro_000309 [Colocasia esculenta]|uniref:Uncharacterized protein n=1 Tax=Colocasia esculenta TaxID=4460 RepID=A0A843TCU9_COLES|nr:hypothetical protein [Colocasia esculenta]
MSLSHCRLSLSRTYNSSKGVRVSRSYRGHSLPQNTLKPPAISRFTPNPPRAPTGIAPRYGVSSRNSTTPHVPRSFNQPSVPVRRFRTTGTRNWGKRKRETGEKPALGFTSTPLLPIATATLNVHILSRQVHTVNGHIPGRQQNSQVDVNPSAANSNRHPKRPHPEPPSSCSQRPHT